MHIARHAIDKKVIVSTYRKYQSDKTALDDLSEYYFALFYCSTVAENDVAKRLAWLDVAIEAAVAKYERVPSGKDYGVTDIDWSESYLSAIIRQNDKAIDRLAATDLEQVKRQDVTKGFEYSFLYAQFLQRLFNKGVDHARDLAKASKASLQVPETSLLYDYMLDIASPQIDLFTYILLRDEEKFNELLLEALESFKEYFERQGEQGKKDPYGLVSIPLSAIVRLAKDDGIAIHHTSDYVPAYLIDAG